MQWRLWSINMHSCAVLWKWTLLWPNSLLINNGWSWTPNIEYSKNRMLLKRNKIDEPTVLILLVMIVCWRHAILFVDFRRMHSSKLSKLQNIGTVAYMNMLVLMSLSLVESLQNTSNASSNSGSFFDIWKEWNKGNV